MLRAPPNSIGIANAVMFMMKLITSPATKAGKVKGRMTRQKTALGLAPSVPAAQESAGSSPLTAAQSGNSTKMKCPGISAMMTPVSLIMSLSGVATMSSSRRIVLTTPLVRSSSVQPRALTTVLTSQGLI
jgi:hypothetical protein